MGIDGIIGGKLTREQLESLWLFLAELSESCASREWPCVCSRIHATHYSLRCCAVPTIKCLCTNDRSRSRPYRWALSIQHHTHLLLTLDAP